ncbi:MAG: Do family serine endopeptidase [Desulfobulbaceae bacterium]|nr:Do family serine endopeptidase [Candidatus Kapabacteria bacterium]MBS4000898.1 Do family serine endopeptidase [Desulfobulbaceae bacterium]
MKRTLIISVLMVGIGIFMGVLLVSNLSLGSLNSLFADENTKLGADNPPIKVDEAAMILNRTFVAASEAVLPTVVYISVDAEITRRGGNPMDGWFERFFGQPDGHPDIKPEQRRQRGSGSGVIISSNGYIVTNNHVVENATKGGIKVMTFDKKEYTAKVVGTDPLTDLALLKIDVEGLNPAHFANIDNLKVGELVLAVGNPIGLNHTVTSGIVSATGRGARGRSAPNSIEHYIQTDAAINPGNSGGGLFDINGSLIGINTAIATETGAFMGYGFAIPVDLVKAVVDDLIDDGQINRGYIGVFITNVDELTAKGFGMPKVQGVLVEDLVPDGAAKSAGVEKGDVILEIEGREVNSPSELQSRIVFQRAGDKVMLTIWRDGKTIKLPVTLKAREEDEVIAGKTSTPDEKEESEDNVIKFDNLGFTVESLTNDIKTEYDVKSGVLVSDVARFGAAAERGLMPSGVITNIDRKPVNSPKELKKILDSKKKGDVIILNVKYPNRSQIVALEVGPS